MSWLSSPGPGGVRFTPGKKEGRKHRGDRWSREAVDIGSGGGGGTSQS